MGGVGFCWCGWTGGLIGRVIWDDFMMLLKEPS
jgi:hypothetical protein